jgi:hypothetical protein
LHYVWGTDPERVAHLYQYSRTPPPPDSVDVSP